LSSFLGVAVPIGGGAEEQVHRLEREVAEARRVLASKEQQLYAWQRGLDGERRTGDVLTALEANGWFVLHDVHWPGRPRANIDHIAIGPGGVFVIDSKNWSGEVAVRDGILRQNGNRRVTECEGAAAAAAGVAAYLEPQHRSLVTAVLCLVDQPTPREQPRQVKVVGLSELDALLGAAAPRLTALDVHRIGDYLRNLLGGSTSPPMKTTAALASAGVAPPEPVRSRTVRHRPAARARRSGPSRRPARRSPSRGGGGTAFTLAKVAAVLFFVLVLPRVWPAVSNNLFDSPATINRTGVVQPAVTSTPKAPGAKRPATKATGTPKAP
jgi:hypothetical protein